MSRSSVCLPVLNGLLYIPLPLSSLSLILQRLPLSPKTRVLKIQNKSNIEILFIKPSYAENYILLLFMGGHGLTQGFIMKPRLPSNSLFFCHNLLKAGIRD